MEHSKESLAAFWKGHKGIGFHQKDTEALRDKDSRIIRWKPKEALEHLWDYDGPEFSNRIHQNLFPVPYAGSLATAQVVVLTQNPGFHPSCYVEDHFDKSYQTLLVKNLKQQLPDFFPINPSISRSGGFSYWRKVFRPIVNALAKERKMKEDKVASSIAPFVAAIELCPYHSFSGPPQWAFDLPSAQEARHYVHDVVLPRAKEGSVLVLCVRAAKQWKIQTKGSKIIVREANRARSPNFTEREQQALIRQLGPLM